MCMGGVVMCMGGGCNVYGLVVVMCMSRGCNVYG